MRKLNGIEVPDWFIINRAPEEMREPDQNMKRYKGGYSFKEGDEPTLSEIISKVPKEFGHTRVEVSATGDYDGNTTVIINWFEWEHDPSYNLKLSQYSKRKEQIKLWHELKSKILIEENN